MFISDQLKLPCVQNQQAEVCCIRVLLISDKPEDILSCQASGFGGDPAKPILCQAQMVCAKSVEDGLSILALGAIDVVLLDLTQLGNTTLESFFRLRKEEPDTPVVILSVIDNEEQAAEAIHAGAQDYLIKGEAYAGLLLLRSLRYAVERHRLMQELSLYDDLTGLHNRRGFKTLAEHQLKMARTHRVKKSLLLAFADMDGLKGINDRLGHETGSRAIRQAAEILRQTFRGADVIGRLGGDEFGILIVDAGGENSETIIGRLEKNLMTFNAQHDCPYTLSLSIGVVRVDPDRPDNIEDLIARADSVMYKHKRSKANRAADVSVHA